MSARPRSWAALLRLAAPHRRAFALVGLLTLLATAADLVEPVIYRYAVNDIAGLFVESGGGHHVSSRALASDATDDAADDQSGVAGLEVAPHATGEPHRAGYVAPRTPEQTLRTLLIAVALLFVVNVVSQRLLLAADQLTVTLASRLEADLIQRTFGHVLRLPMQWFSRRATGGIGRQIDQSDHLAPIVRAAAHEIAPEVLRMAGAMAIMATQSWRLTLVALITLPPYIWIVTRSSRRLESGLERYYAMWEDVSGRIQDALAAIKTVKLSGAELRESARLREYSDAAYATHVERNRLANGYLFWQRALTHLSQALVLGYGGWLVLARQLTPGDVVMFVVYLDKLYSPIDSLTSLSVTLQENLASVKRALRLLAGGGEEARGAPLAPGPGAVEFRDVRFGYDASREVLRGVSFALAPGRVTALVGPSGAGKTTTVDLLLRLFEPAGGEIRIDGQRLADLDPAAVRAAVSVVAADGAIFRATLADNLRYKRPDASDAELLAAAHDAGLDRLLERLPDGLATEIGERGVGVSVGERQRIQIARALVSRPRVLILDEATANLDYATERDIRHAVLQRAPRPTTLVIAHRWSMVEHADHVIVLDGGQVRAAGTPAELIAAGGWFAEFAASAGENREAHA